MTPWIEAQVLRPADLQDVIFIDQDGTAMVGWYAAANDSFIAAEYKCEGEYVREWYPIPKLPEGASWTRC